MGDLVLGSVLGRCRIDETIGRGGMGVVYRARQLELGRDVALKVIAPERTADESVRRRFLREIRAAAAIEHPNIVPVHDAGVDDGHAFVVMRFIAGADLRALIGASGPLPAERAAAIMRPLGEALDAIHRAGYVHRDVKPANVLLDDDGHVYLSDFGIAKDLLSETETTETGKWVGTVDFAAPEQIRGEPVDARTDVYALGSVLFFMLAGHAPFARPGREARIYAQLTDPPPSARAGRPELPRAVDAVIARALAKDPGDRYASAGELARDAGVVLAGGEPTAAVPVRRRRARRARRRGAVAAALVAAAGLVALLTAGSDPPERPVRPTPGATAPVTPASHRAKVVKNTRGVLRHPRGLAVAAGKVWAISLSRARIERFDAETLEEDPLKPRIGKGAYSIAGDGDAVWVANPSRGVVLRVADDGTLGRPIRTPLTPVRVAVDRGGVWIVGRAPLDDPDAVYRYDRDGNDLLGGDPIEVAEDIAEIVPVPGGVAVATTGTPPQLLEFTRDGRPGRTTSLLSRPVALAQRGGTVWASMPDGDALVRHPPDREKDVTGKPAQLAIARGRLFVALTTTSQVAVLNPRSMEGYRLDVGTGNPRALVAGAGHVYVAGRSDNSLWRIDP